MTKRHFIAIAAAIRELADAGERDRMCDVLIPVFRASNPNFDVARFRAAANAE